MPVNNLRMTHWLVFPSLNDGTCVINTFSLTFHDAKQVKTVGLNLVWCHWADHAIAFLREAGCWIIRLNGVQSKRRNWTGCCPSCRRKLSTIRIVKHPENPVRVAATVSRSPNHPGMEMAVKTGTTWSGNEAGE